MGGMTVFRMETMGVWSFSSSFQLNGPNRVQLDEKMLRNLMTCLAGWQISNLEAVETGDED